MVFIYALVFSAGLYVLYLLYRVMQDADKKAAAQRDARALYPKTPPSDPIPSIKENGRESVRLMDMANGIWRRALNNPQEEEGGDDAALSALAAAANAAIKAQEPVAAAAAVAAPEPAAAMNAAAVTSAPPVAPKEAAKPKAPVKAGDGTEPLPFNHDISINLWTKYVAPVARDPYRQIIKDILTLLDHEGATAPSIVKMPGYEEPDNRYGQSQHAALKKITVLQHSARVVEYIIPKLTDKGYTMTMGGIIAALGHDLGKLPLYRETAYSYKCHPITSTVLVQPLLTPHLGTSEVETIIAAIKDHHNSAAGGHILTPLKHADERARNDEYVLAAGMDGGDEEMEEFTPPVAAQPQPQVVPAAPIVVTPAVEIAAPQPQPVPEFIVPAAPVFAAVETLQDVEAPAESEVVVSDEDDADSPDTDSPPDEEMSEDIEMVSLPTPVDTELFDNPFGNGPGVPDAIKEAAVPDPGDEESVFAPVATKSEEPVFVAPAPITVSSPTPVVPAVDPTPRAVMPTPVPVVQPPVVPVTPAPEPAQSGAMSGGRPDEFSDLGWFDSHRFIQLLHPQINTVASERQGPGGFSTRDGYVYFYVNTVFNTFMKYALENNWQRIHDYEKDQRARRRVLLHVVMRLREIGAIAEELMPGPNYFHSEFLVTFGQTDERPYRLVPLRGEAFTNDIMKLEVIKKNFFKSVTKVRQKKF